jgi:hypothetical protein
VKKTFRFQFFEGQLRHCEPNKESVWFTVMHAAATGGVLPVATELTPLEFTGYAQLVAPECEREGNVVRGRSGGSQWSVKILGLDRQ